MIEASTPNALPRDPLLPWLSTALDGARMAPHFIRSVLPTFAPTQPRRFELRNCTIEHVRYRPGRNCAIAYRLQVLDHATRQDHDLRFQARMYPPDAAPSRHAKAAAQPLATPPLGPPLHLIAPLGMVLWAFPNERKIAGLGQVLDPRALADEVLPEVISRGWGGDWHLESCHHEVLRYVPEHALTMRVQAHIRNGTTGERRPIAVFGKCYHDAQAARTFDTLRALRTHGRAPLRVPEPLCHQPEHRLLWQEALPGVPMADLLRVRCATAPLLRQAGEQIAALHATPVRVSDSLRFAQIAARIGSVEQLLAAHRKDLLAPVRALARALQERQPADAATPVLLHGDLHAKNLLAGSAGVGLIDLDSCAMGAAEWDLGSLLAALAAGAHDAHSGIKGQAEWLLDGYGAAERATNPWPELDWSIACALLVERGARSVSRLKPGRMAALPGLIALAQAVLERGWREALP